MKLKTAVDIFYWMAWASAIVSIAVFTYAQFLNDVGAAKDALTNLTLAVVVMALCLVANPKP